MATKQQVRAGIYVRISADHAGESLGVQRQIDKCRQLAESLGYDVVEVYVDNDLTAMKANNRPEYLRMLEDVKAGVITAVVAWHTDRIYRRAADLAEFVEVIENARIPVRTVTAGDIDLTTASGRMTARILGSVALHEIEHAQERMLEASQQSALDGRWRIRVPMFGYTQHGESVVENEAVAIREAAQWLLAGISTGEISRRWNKTGLTTREWNSWTSKKVVAVLKNPMYAGLSVYKGEIVGKGQWPKIIEEETHRAIAGILNGRRTVARDRRWQGSGVYKCGKCGATMRVTPNGSANGKVNFYCCRETSHLWRRQDTLDEYIDARIIHRLSRKDAKLLLRSNDNRADIPALRVQRDALQKRLRTLATMFAVGEIDGDQLKEGTAQIKTDTESVDAQLEAATRHNPLADLIGADDITAVWEGKTPAVRGKIIAFLMDVTVLPCPKGRRGFDPNFVRIEWKPLTN